MKFVKEHYVGIILIVGVLAGISSMAALAQGKSTTESGETHYAAVKQQLIEVQADEQALARAIDAGQGRTVFCRTCHGENGIAKRENVPNLAGQNPLYLYTQLERFSDGRRYDFLMAGLAKNLSKDDIFNIALFYSNLPPKASDGGVAQLAASGKEIYAVRCVACHLDSGQGSEQIPRLAGQQPSYIKKMLKEFRMSTGRRENTQMSAIAAGLTDKEITALSSYLAGLD